MIIDTQAPNVILVHLHRLQALARRVPSLNGAVEQAAEEQSFPDTEAEDDVTARRKVERAPLFELGVPLANGCVPRSAEQLVVPHTQRTHNVNVTANDVQAFAIPIPDTHRAVIAGAVQFVAPNQWRI